MQSPLRIDKAIERRDFLMATAIGTLSLACQGVIAAEEPQKFKIGMAATEWLATDHSTAMYWKAAEAIAQLGIGATEADNSDAHLDTAYGADPAAFVSRSRKIGVHLFGVYQALPLHEQTALPPMLAKVRSDGKFLRAAKAEYIALGWAPPPPVGGKPYQRTQRDVEQAIRAANQIGQVSYEEYGILAAFHAERDIPKDMVLQILDGTDPKYVKLCADVGHLTAMGLDALQVVKKYASRLAVSHWKDFAPNIPGPKYLGKDTKGDFVELGKGVVDFRGLADFYRSIGFAGWVMVELDHTRMSSIVDSALTMKEFVTDQLKLRFYPPEH